MLKVWDSYSHRATMDIDLLARTSNQLENLRHILIEIANIACEEDGIVFDTQRMAIHRIQIGSEYEGVAVSFSAKLFTTYLPLIVDIGFNDTIIPSPQTIEYPTLLGTSKLTLFAYTLETIVAEKLQSIVKLGMINTRMKDFFDLWTLLKIEEINENKLSRAISTVFSNRKTQLKWPIAFTPIFYTSPEKERLWFNFLALMGKPRIEFSDVIADISEKLKIFINEEQPSSNKLTT